MLDDIDLKKEEDKLDYKKMYEELNPIINSVKSKTSEHLDLLSEHINLQSKYLKLLKNSKSREEEQFDEYVVINNKLKKEIINLKCMMKNMLLSLVCTQSDDMEWNVRNDYGMNYSDEYLTYKDTVMKEQIEEMNDTDWNESEPAIKSVLEYEPQDEIIYLHFDDDDESDEDEVRSEVFSDEE